MCPFQTYKALQKKLAETKNTVYGNLTPWQKVQLSRHPSRPYTLDYIKNILGDSFLELHGDGNISDDKAMIGGLGKMIIKLLCSSVPKKEIILK